MKGFIPFGVRGDEVDAVGFRRFGPPVRTQGEIAALLGRNLVTPQIEVPSDVADLRVISATPPDIEQAG